MSGKKVLGIVLMAAVLGVVGWLRVARVGRMFGPRNETVFTEGETIGVDANDPEMLQAFEAARKTLPFFWKRMESPGANEENFAVKVPVRDSNGVEYFWLEQVSHADGRVRGGISNEPEHVRSVTFGQFVEMPESLIVDWMYTRNDAIVGGYTARVLIERIKRANPAAAGDADVRFEDP